MIGSLFLSTCIRIYGLWFILLALFKLVRALYLLPSLYIKQYFKIWDNFKFRKISLPHSCPSGTSSVVICEVHSNMFEQWQNLSCFTKLVFTNMTWAQMHYIWRGNSELWLDCWKSPTELNEYVKLLSGDEYTPELSWEPLNRQWCFTCISREQPNGFSHCLG